MLKEGGIAPDDLDAVGFYDKPFLKFERMLSTYIATFPRSFASFRKAMPVWMKEKLWIPRLIRKELRLQGPDLLRRAPPVARGVGLPGLAVRGGGDPHRRRRRRVGDHDLRRGQGNDIKLFKEIRFPHSLGLLYSAFTYYLGFKVNSAEYKVMGLAPYGKPVHFDRIMKEMIHLHEDGSFKLNMKYFATTTACTMTNGAFDELFGGPPRKPETWMERARVRHGRHRAEGERGGRAADGALPPQGDGAHEPVHGRRRRAQLRRQRADRPRDAR